VSPAKKPLVSGLRLTTPMKKGLLNLFYDEMTDCWLVVFIALTKTGPYLRSRSQGPEITSDG
jgi:hypothetical protein